MTMTISTKIKKMPLPLLYIFFLFLFLCAGCTSAPAKSGAAATPSGQGGPESPPPARPSQLEFEKPWVSGGAPADVQGRDRFEKKFSALLPLDSLLDRRGGDIEIKLASSAAPGLHGASRTSGHIQPENPAARFRIQVLTVSDFETAQKMKFYYSRLLEGQINVLFDAPFYKLRYGIFTSRQKADEKLLDLRELGLQGFVIKE